QEEVPQKIVRIEDRPLVDLDRLSHPVAVRVIALDEEVQARVLPPAAHRDESSIRSEGGAQRGRGRPEACQRDRLVQWLPSRTEALGVPAFEGSPEIDGAIPPDQDEPAARLGQEPRNELVDGTARTAGRHRLAGGVE